MDGISPIASQPAGTRAWVRRWFAQLWNGKDAKSSPLHEPSFFNASLCGDGIALACAVIENGDQDFIRFAKAMGQQLDLSPMDLRPYLRSWYEGARHGCVDNGIDVSGCSTDREIRVAMETMSIWADKPLDPSSDVRPETAGKKPSTCAEIPSHKDLYALMGLALTAPTSEAIMQFVGFASRFRSFAPFNVQMIYAQRPAAGLVASRRDWELAGRTVRRGAIPIIVLRPRGPIEYVFEELDTDPPIKRDPANDAFAVTGKFDLVRLQKLIDALAKPEKRHLVVRVHRPPIGANLAGWLHNEPIQMSVEVPSVHKDMKASKTMKVSVWDISINRQFTEAEQFVTLLHELGHLFCGHAGSFSDNNRAAEEYGWPDRRNLPKAAKEIEAELVAWWLANREGLTTGSPVYLRPHLDKAGSAVSLVDLDRVTRAVVRIRGYLGDPRQ